MHRLQNEAVVHAHRHGASRRTTDDAVERLDPEIRDDGRER